MADCSKCGQLLSPKHSCQATGICVTCREKTHTYCYGCRCYGIIVDRCFVCKPNFMSTVDVGLNVEDEPVKKVYKDECPCGLKVAQCTYHASQAG